MECGIFKDSGFKHGQGEDDYEAVMRHPKLVLRSRCGFHNLYEILGRNDEGEYLRMISRRFRKDQQRIVKTTEGQTGTLHKQTFGVRAHNSRTHDYEI